MNRSDYFLGVPVEVGQLGKPLASVGVTGPEGARTCYPSTEKQAGGFSPMLLCVLRLGSCQWNWVVAGATAAFDWPLMVPVRPPNSM